MGFIHPPRPQKPWFRISNGAEVVEGRRLHNKSLELIMRFQGEFIYTKVPEHHVEELIRWLVRAYPVPRKELSNVVQLADLISLRESKDNTGSGPDYSGG